MSTSVETPAVRRTTNASDLAAALGKNRRSTSIGIGVWALVAIAGFGLPYALALYPLEIAVQGATLGLLALSVGWLLRQSGLLSFGHAAFYGATGYATGILGARTDLPAMAVVLLAIAVGTFLAFVVALLIARATGITFAMLTLAIGMLLWVAVTRARDFTNGFDGLGVKLEGSVLGTDASMYVSTVKAWPLVWGALMVSIGALWIISRSRFGRTLTAIRDNEERVQFMGAGTVLPRIIAVTISGFFASVAGAVSSLHSGIVTPENLYWTMSGTALVVAIIGGFGSVWGPPIGAILFTALQAFLSESNHYQAIVGLSLIVVVVVAPGGISGVAAQVAQKVRRRVGGHHGTS